MLVTEGMCEVEGLFGGDVAIEWIDQCVSDQFRLFDNVLVEVAGSRRG